MNRPDGRSSVWNCFWIAAAYAVLLLLTRSPELGDTAIYSQAVEDHLGKSPFAVNNSLWEFGHLLWRPAGWLLLTCIAPLLSRFTDWTNYMQAAFALMVICWATSIATVVLWYLLLEDLMRSRAAAFFIASALACAHGFILYAHSGSSYIPGLAGLTASVYCIRKGRLLLAALFYGLGTFFWVPYVLGGPALLLLAAMSTDWALPVRDSWTRLHWGSAMRFLVFSCVVILAGYGLGGVARGVKSAADVKDWVADANHGWSQNQRALRLATGLPRSTFYLGTDGMQFKRFLRHDPYSPVGIIDLAKASLWKMAVFYVFLALMVFELWRRSASLWPLLIFLAGACPIVFFSVFVFEPSSPPRFLPAFPFTLLVLGWAFRDLPEKPRFTHLNFVQALMAVLMVVIGASNVFAFAAPWAAREDQAAWSRLAQLRSRIPANSAIVVTTNQDKLEQYLGRSIFGQVNRPYLFLVYDVIEPGTIRMLQWREGFATYVFNTWKNGGEVWVSRRVWSEKPKPDWNWVEKDDPLQIWGDLNKFFVPIQTDQECDGPDGFARLAHDEANVSYLTPFAAAYKAPSYVPVAASQ